VKQKHKEFIIALVTFIGGLYFFLEFMVPGIAGFLFPGLTFPKFLALFLPNSFLPTDFETNPNFQFSTIDDAVSLSLQVVSVMAIGLGIINILRVHVGAITRGRKGWINSLALIIGLFMVFTFETIDLVNLETKNSYRERIENLILFTKQIEKDEKSISPAPRVEAMIAKLETFQELSLTEKEVDQTLKNNYLQAIEASIASATILKETYLNKSNVSLKIANKKLIENLKFSAEESQTLANAQHIASTSYLVNHFFYEAFFTPLGSAMFSLLAFYIATAAYRSFRVRSLEAFVMMALAIIVMLGQIPHGVRYIPELPQWRFWLLSNISTPAFRAITFGSLIAGLAMAVRMWLSMEKSPFSSDSELSSKEGISS
jgi:hypothetical protein